MARFKSGNKGSGDLHAWYDASRGLRSFIGQADNPTNMGGFFFTAAGTLTAAPMLLGAPQKIEDIAVSLSALEAGKNMRVGIYRNKGVNNLYPGALVIDLGLIDLNLGIGDSPCPAQVPPVSLAAGLYWIGAVDDGVLGSSMLCWSSDQSLKLLPPPNVGGSCLHGISIVQAFGALPDPFPAGGTDVSSDLVPGYGVKFV